SGGSNSGSALANIVAILRILTAVSLMTTGILYWRAARTCRALVRRPPTSVLPRKADAQAPSSASPLARASGRADARSREDRARAAGGPGCQDVDRTHRPPA